MTLRNYQQSLQKSLFADAVGTAVASRWRTGTTIDYLGRPLQLKLDTDRRQALREDDVLHLPLPPDATARQVQDAAESWQRREAKMLFTRLIAAETIRLARNMPALSLSFSLRGSWVQVEPQLLRLNWRLIEQPLPVIELTLRRAVASLPEQSAIVDMFSALD